MQPTRLKKIKFIVMTVILVILACLLIAEGVIRIYHWTDDRQRFIWLPDEISAYVHSANNTFKFHFTEQKRITAEHRTNRYGFLGPDIVVPKGERTRRVLVLGDSITEALQVDRRHNYTGLLEEYLNNYPDGKTRHVEVINAGVSGYSPLNYYLNFKRQYARLKPDLVIVQLFANDVFEDHTARAKSILDENGLPLKTGRYFQEDIFRHPPVDRATFDDNPLRYRVLRFLIEKSRFAEYMYVKIYNLKKASRFHQGMIRKDEFGTGYQFFINDPGSVLSRKPGFREEAWRYTQQLLLALREEVVRSGSAFMLLYVPMEAQLKLDQYGVHMQLYATGHLGPVFNAMLAWFSGEHGIHYLDLLEPFETQKHRGLYLNRDGHMTENGHALAAEQLYEYVIANDLLNQKLKTQKLKIQNKF